MIKKKAAIDCPWPQSPRIKSCICQLYTGRAQKIYVLRRDVLDIFANNWVPSDEFVFVHHSAPFMEKISGQTLPSYPQIFSFLAAALLGLPVELAFILFFQLLNL